MKSIFKQWLSVFCAVALLCTMCALGTLPVIAAATTGDINGDGNVTAADTRCILLALANGTTLPQTADMNGDGAVNTLDARVLLLYILSQETTDPMTIQLKVGTYNIANGRETKWDFSIIAQDIVDNDLDIVGIQEVDQFCNRSNKSDTLALLKEYTGMPYGVFFKCIDYNGGEYGTAILSKYPILETDELELNDGSIVERRLLTYAKINVNGTVINFFNTHLTVASDDIRATEFQLVAECVKDMNNCLLVGDFNVDSYTEFEILEPLAYINNPETGYITHPKDGKQIDNICYSSEFRSVENGHGIYDQQHSDHVLLYAEFDFDVE